MTVEHPPAIETAIGRVYAAVGFVRKERAAGLPYSFASEAAIIEQLRPAMIEAGITVRVVALRDVCREPMTTKGGTTNRTTLIAKVRFSHAQSGTYVDVETIGEGMDPGDKGAGKAMTGALKYALRQTFLLETGEDPEGGAYERAHPAYTSSPYPWREAFDRAQAMDKFTKADISTIIGAKSTAENVDAWLASTGKPIGQAVNLFRDARAKRLNESGEKPATSRP